MAEQTAPQAIKVDLINEETYKHYINSPADQTEGLSFSDWASREQIRLLRGINSKLNFFVLLIILGMILSFFQAMMR